MLSIALAFGIPAFQGKHHLDGVGVPSVLAVKQYYSDINIAIVNTEGRLRWSRV